MKSTFTYNNSEKTIKWPLFGLLALLLFVFNACGTDNPAEENEEELINEVHIKFMPQGGGEEIEWTWKVEEGSSAEPMILTSPLAANTVYDMSIELYGEAHSHDGEEEHSDDDHDHGDDENITEEIREEGAEHQFFFSITPSSLGVSFNYLDEDAAGNPIGLLTEVSTTNAGTGELSIILRHDLNKTAEGVAAGSITNAGGSTDISISLPLVIN
jgi:hypothetical protein